MASGDLESIAVVGGGITGLFCAWVLKQRGHEVVLYESSDRIGGRIRTLRLGAGNESLENNWSKDNLDFCVEFGTLEMAPRNHLLTRALLDRLDVPLISAPNLDQVSSTSSSIDNENRYELEQLLLTAITRIIGRVEFQDAPGTPEDQLQVRRTVGKKSALISELTTAPQTAKGTHRVIRRWIRDRLDDGDFWALETQAHFAETPLYALGIWNILNEVLSPDERKLLANLTAGEKWVPAENPNAAEVLVSWLRTFARGAADCSTVFGGTQSIVELMLSKIPQLNEMQNSRTIKYSHHVKKLYRNERKGWTLELEVGRSKEKVTRKHSRVILAIPKLPLQELVNNSLEQFEQLDAEISRLLDAAIAVPSVKAFAIVESSWWGANEKALTLNAGSFSYNLQRSTGDLGIEQHAGSHARRRGLLLFETLRPGAEYWRNYVGPGTQCCEDVFRTGGREHPRLRQQIEDILSTAGEAESKTQTTTYGHHVVSGRFEPEVSCYGIRDWGRPPYGAAIHAWKPQRNFRAVLARLAEVGISSGVHVCGEAFSDFHGTVEGALRSAVYALQRAFVSRSRNDLTWLDQILPELQKDKSGQQYFHFLSQNVGRLDVLRTEEFESEPYPTTISARVHVNSSTNAEVMLLQMKDWETIKTKLAYSVENADATAAHWYQLTRKNRLAVGKQDITGLFTLSEVPVEIRPDRHLIVAVQERCENGFSYWFKLITPCSNRGNSNDIFDVHPEVLPPTSHPTGYRVNLRLNRRSLSFTGRTQIELVVSKSTDELVLNAREIFVRSCALRAVMEDDHVVDSIPVKAVNCGERIIFRTEQIMKPGNYELIVEYSGIIQQSAESGFFTGAYSNENGNWTEVLMANFGSGRRRSLLPCWDEHQFNAPYTVSIELESTEYIVSNIEHEPQISESRGAKQVTFAHIERAGQPLQIAIGKSAIQGMDWHELASQIFFDKDTGPGDRAASISHENEIDMRVQCESSVDSEAAQLEKNGNQLPSAKDKYNKLRTHAKHKVRTTSQFRKIEADTIAAPDTSMAASSNNADSTKEELAAEHVAEVNVQAEDSAKAKTDISASLMTRTFIEEGEPLLCVQMQNGKVFVTQTAYSHLPPSKKFGSFSPVSVCYRYATATGTVREGEFITAPPRTALPLQPGERLLFLNASGRGSFKTKYEKTFSVDLDYLAQDRTERLCYLSDVWSLVMAHDPDTTISTYLDLLRNFHMETDKNIWDFIVYSLSCINVLIDEEMRGSFAERVQRILEDVYDRFVPVNSTPVYPIASSDADEDERERNAMVLQAMAILGNAAEAKTRALNWFDDYTNGMPIDSYLVSAVLNVVAFAQPADDLIAASKTYEYIVGLYQQARKWSKQDSDTLRSCLSFFQHPQLVNRTLEFAMSDDCDTSEAETLIVSIMEKPWGQSQAWEFVKNRRRTEDKRVHNLAIKNLTEGIAGLITDGARSIDVLKKNSAAFEADVRAFLQEECDQITADATCKKLSILNSVKLVNYEYLLSTFKAIENIDQPQEEESYPIGPMI